MELHVRNVNEAFYSGLELLYDCGMEEPSRNGKVLVVQEPVMTVYEVPTERVLFSPLRDANPFFHLMESLWMLAGRNDLAWPMYFNRNFASYSDDNVIVPAAYGERWRLRWGIDQLAVIVRELKTKPESRRAVLAMWGAHEDLPRIGTSKDVPCNTHAYFDVRGGVLNMTVCCRSNDVIWGAYGANVVHFSILQEFLAAWIGVEVGVYRQFSLNFHVYLDVLGNREKLMKLALEGKDHDYYTDKIYAPYGWGAKPSRLVNIHDIGIWQHDLKSFLANPWLEKDVLYSDAFFSRTAVPVYQAWFERKQKISNGLARAKTIIADDWRIACVNWIERREEAAKIKGVSA